MEGFINIMKRYPNFALLLQYKFVENQFNKSELRRIFFKVFRIYGIALLRVIGESVSFFSMAWIFCFTFKGTFSMSQIHGLESQIHLTCNMRLTLYGTSKLQLYYFLLKTMTRYEVHKYLRDTNPIKSIKSFILIWLIIWR